jgi:hypothetical protein
MNRHKGSALLMVLFITNGVSLLLINLNYRFSLLVQTVMQREKQIQYVCAAQACMFYAIQLAKHNWYQICTKIDHEPLLYTGVPWYITLKNMVYVSILFKKAEQGVMIAIELSDDAQGKRESISCTVTPVGKIQKEIQLVISDWKER